MKTKTESPTKTYNFLPPLAIGFFIGVIVVGTVVLVWNNDAPARSDSDISTFTTRATTPSTNDPTAQQTGNSSLSASQMSTLTTLSATMDAAVFRVASRFDCLCSDQCGKRVDVCTCATAKEERTFIQNQLQQGHSEEEAAKALNQKYGGLKS